VLLLIIGREQGLYYAQIAENLNSVVFFLLRQTKRFTLEMEIHIRVIGAFRPFFARYQLFWEISRILLLGGVLHSNFRQSYLRFPER
jgi:hypothetical protein